MVCVQKSDMGMTKKWGKSAKIQGNFKLQYCQARVLVLVQVRTLRIQKSETEKDQSLRYNPNAPTTTTNHHPPHNFSK